MRERTPVDISPLTLIPEERAAMHLQECHLVQDGEGPYFHLHINVQNERELPSSDEMLINASAKHRLIEKRILKEGESVIFDQTPTLLLTPTNMVCMKFRPSTTPSKEHPASDIVDPNDPYANSYGA